MTSPSLINYQSIREAFFNTMRRAVMIRVERGENIDEVLASYTYLSEEDRASIKKQVVIE